MEALIRASGRTPRQRTTGYGRPRPGQVERSHIAAPLSEIVTELTNRKWAGIAAK
jgi:hypothetical protein